MSHLLSSIIPLSIGAAFSPTVLAFTIVLLGGKKAPRARVAFMILGMFIVLVFIALTAGSVSQAAKSEGVKQFLKLLDIVFALILFYLGVRSLIKKPSEGASSSRLMGHNRSELGPVRFIPIGFAVMLTDISSIVLFIPAIRDIGLSSVGTPDKILIAGIPFTAVLIPALVPLFADMIAPKTTGGAMKAINTWLARHNRVVTGGVSFIFSAFLFWKGVWGS